MQHLWVSKAWKQLDPEPRCCKWALVEMERGGRQVQRSAPIWTSIQPSVPFWGSICHPIAKNRLQKAKCLSTALCAPAPSHKGVPWPKVKQYLLWFNDWHYKTALLVDLCSYNWNCKHWSFHQPLFAIKRLRSRKTSLGYNQYWRLKQGHLTFLSPPCNSATLQGSGYETDNHQLNPSPFCLCQEQLLVFLLLLFLAQGKSRASCAVPGCSFLSNAGGWYKRPLDLPKEH